MAISTLPFGSAIAQPGAGPETFDIESNGSLSYALGGIGVRINLATGFADRGIATGDTLLNSSTATNFTLYGSNTGADILAANNLGSYLFGGGARDTLIGGSGNDTLNGGYGSDTAPYDKNLNGDATPYVGNNGSDTVDYSGVTGSGIIVSLGSPIEGSPTVSGYDIKDDTTGFGNTVGKATGASIGTDILISIENVIGSNFADRITGNGSPNNLSGGAGNDTLDGGAGTAVDTLIGGAGSDVFYVRRAGDTVIEAANEGTDRVLSFVNYNLTTDTANVEQLFLQGTSDLKGTGTDVNNTIVGNDAANVLLGLGGNDIINGDAGINIGGNDSIDGGTGNDTITGRKGADTLTGGTGSDKFVYTSTTDSLRAAYDVITDFTVSDDTFDVSAVPTTVTNAGQFDNLDAAVAGIIFTGTDSVVFTLGSGEQFVAINNNTTAGAFGSTTDAIIQLTGTSSPVANITTANFV